MRTQETMLTPSREATRNQLRWYAKTHKQSAQDIFDQALYLARILETGRVIPLCTYEKLEALLEDVLDNLHELED